MREAREHDNTQQEQKKKKPIASCLQAWNFSRYGWKTAHIASHTPSITRHRRYMHLVAPLHARVGDSCCGSFQLHILVGCTQNLCIHTRACWVFRRIKISATGSKVYSSTAIVPCHTQHLGRVWKSDHRSTKLGRRNTRVWYPAQHILACIHTYIRRFTHIFTYSTTLLFSSLLLLVLPLFANVFSSLGAVHLRYVP